MNRRVLISSIVIFTIGTMAPGGLFAGDLCIVPDNGTGTADLPPQGCKYLGHMRIIDGLPMGATIEIDASWQDFACDAAPHAGCSVTPAPGKCEASGGTSGGTGYCSEDTLVMVMTGTGSLTGFVRTLWVDVVSEIHTGPRNPGDPVQTFTSNLMELQGELFGDPDFCTFRVRAGVELGLPSPGQTTLTEQLPSGDFAVDSFFDITYQIEFEGCPASPLGGFMGTTTDLQRFETGFVDPAGTCIEPDNGSGTVDLPADCPYIAPANPMYIIDGLPVGSTLELDPTLDGYLNIVRTPGGSLGGEIETFDATLDLVVTGTGDFAGFNRHLAVPVNAEIHTGPRNPGDPVQTLTTAMYKLTGELFGDPDFCTFRVRAGSFHGLPSPGETTLTELPSGDFAVDSFFDITYQIEFDGCPGSPLDDLSGTTTATVFLVQGTLYLPSPPTCGATDNGGGTVDLPADCPYVAPDDPMYITEGLPVGTTLELDPTLDDYAGIVRTPGGYFGGEIEEFDATLHLVVTGTGDFAGYNRSLAVPIDCAIHTGPRNPGDPVQTLAAEMASLTGELFGDPDFCTFRVRAGTDNGMAGAGTTVLTKLPTGDFAVDSFFDITYQIEFEGCPGSPLDGLSGTTRATVRLLQGDTATCYPADGDMNGDTLIDGRDIQLFVDGAINGATPAEICHGDFDGLGSLDVGDIPDFVERLLLGQPLHPSCVMPDNGGTVDLPADCPMTAPDGPMYIIDGITPVGSTLELDPTLDGYLNIIRTPGGSLGGEIETFDATLDLVVTGTGDFDGFNRHLAVSVSAEIHTGPRNPGDPVQTFTSNLMKLEGELFGDPDFCTFRVRAGSDNGLPSPGQTTLTKLPTGDFAVDSFFDITYQIEFEGCPGSPLDGMAGTTTATVLLVQGG